MPDRSEATQLLKQATKGTHSAVDELFGLVYPDLRRLAESYLREERADHTLQATALVHEAYLRLIDGTEVDWKDRAHFFAVSARAMRRILVDHARRRGSLKRVGNRKRLSLDDALTLATERVNTDLIALDMALERLALNQPVKARVVELRFFGGLTTEETAEVLSVTERTVWRHWEYAQAYLYREMTRGNSGAV
jgi:RNA polymerase sigma factor (TIGR02999 family)